MKKALVFLLTLALAVGMALPVCAASSPTATKEDLVPELVIADGETVEYEIISMEDIDKLPEEAQETVAEAKEKLTEAAPEGMAVKYFFYFSTEKTVAPTIKIADMDNFESMVIMQFIDGEWVELEYVINEDGTITIIDAVDAPMAIFVK